MKEKLKRPIALMGIILTLSALTYAADGTCTPSYPKCPSPLPQENDVCDGGGGLIEIVYRGQYYVFACTGKSSACQPSGADCNVLMRFSAQDAIEFSCGDGPKTFCIVSGLSAPVSMGRNCSGAPCGPNPLPLPGDLTPPCATCPPGIFPDPPIGPGGD